MGYATLQDIHPRIIELIVIIGKWLSRPSPCPVKRRLQRTSTLESFLKYRKNDTFHDVSHFSNIRYSEGFCGFHREI